MAVPHASSLSRAKIRSGAAVAMVAIALAGCGGGGGDSPAPAPAPGPAPAPSPAPAPAPAPVPVAAMKFSSPVGFVIGTATKDVPVLVTAANGTVLTGKTVAWTSSNPAVATVSGTGTVGIVTGRTPGTTVLTATSEGVSTTMTLTVHPVPATFAAFKALFPYRAGQLSGMAVGSDLSQSYSDVQLAHLNNSWTFLTGLFPKTPGAYTQVFHTWDKGVLDQAKASFANCTSAVNRLPGRFVLLCDDGTALAPYKTLIVSPEADATTGTVPQDSATNLASVGQNFLQAIKNGANDPFQWPWVWDGWGFAVKSGTFDGAGAYSMTKLAEPENGEFKKMHAAGTLLPLAALGALTKAETSSVNVPQSAMLMSFAYRSNPTAVKNLFAAIDAGTIASGPAALDFLRQQMGYATLDAMQAAYWSWGSNASN